MKRLMIAVVVALFFSVSVDAFAMGRNPKCNANYYPGNGTNSKYLWNNVTGGVTAKTNADAIVMWEKNLVTWQSTSRDYSAEIKKVTEAIAEAQTLDPLAQAKNPFFETVYSTGPNKGKNRAEDFPDLFWACEKGLIK